jgi:Alkylmercury lyase
VTADIETAVHYRYVEPLLATGRIPTADEVAQRLAVPVAEVRRALQGLAKNHGVVLHEHVCEPWVIHPFSATPTATWVESGDRGCWATCMWCACGVATLVGGNATIHTRIGGEAEDIDIHVEKGRVWETDLWVHFAVPPRKAWDCIHHFCATVLPFHSPTDVRTWSDRHGIPMGAVAPISQVMDLGREWYARHADPDWRKWSVREAAEIFRKVGLVGDFWEIPVTEGGF